MKNLIIVGAGGLGREVHWLAKQSVGYGKEFVCKGFLEKQISEPLSEYPNYPPILGLSSSYPIENNDVFVCAIGNVKRKKAVVDGLLKRGARFINLVHNSANIAPNTSVGMGNIIGPLVQISCDCKIGSFNTFNSNVTVGHDVQIADYCHLNAFAFVGGEVQLADSVTIHPHASIMPAVSIGDSGTVGVGGIVVKDVLPNTTVFGNPAKAIT